MGGFCEGPEYSLPRHSAASSEASPPRPARARVHTLRAWRAEAPREGGSGGNTTHRPGRSGSPRARRSREERAVRGRGSATTWSAARSVDAGAGEGDAALGTVRPGRGLRALEGNRRRCTSSEAAAAAGERPRPTFSGALRRGRQGRGIPGKISGFSARLFGMQTVTFGDFAQARMDTPQAHTHNPRGTFFAHFYF